MQPQQTDLPHDYLDQIAAPKKQPGMNNKLFLSVVIGGALIAILVGIFLVFSGMSSKPAALQTLGLRLETIQKVSNDSQKTIKSGKLRTINSNLTLYLTNTNRDLALQLTSNGIDLKKLDKNEIADESGDELTKKLEEARLNVVFDRTYANELTYQLETIDVLMNQVYKSTKSKSLKTFLESSNTGLQALKKQFSEFNATNE